MTAMISESDPAVSLPLLLGLSRNKGRRVVKKRGDRKVGAVGDGGADATRSATECAERELRTLPLPSRIHRLLSSSPPSGPSPPPSSSSSPANAALAWNPHGRSWKIRDPDGAAFDELLRTRFDGLDLAAFKGELERWGFRACRRGPDEGSYRHPDFLRGRPDRALKMSYSEKEEGRGDAVTKDADDAATDNAPNAPDAGGAGFTGGEPQHSEEVSSFLAFTGTSDANVARQYLEMSGNNLETAVSLFMDHGGSALGAMGGALGGIGGEALLASVAGIAGIPAPMGGGGGDLGQQVKAGEEEEPDFYSMPPMPMDKEEREPSPSEKIVERALREYLAFRTLRRALLGWMQRRRTQNKTPSSPTAVTKAMTMAKRARDLQHGTSHFLYRSLLHSSLPVRRAAARMVLDSLHRVKVGGGSGGGEDADGNAKRSGEGLREALAVLLHGLMFGEAPYQTSAWPQADPCGMVVPQCKNQAEGGDPALQLAAMLGALVCDGGFSGTLVGEEAGEIRRMQQATVATCAAASGAASSSAGTVAPAVPIAMYAKEEILSKSFLRELSSNSIESFVAMGGLRWACGSIVRLVHLLVHGPDGGANYNVLQGHSGSDSEGSHRGRSRRLRAERTEDVTAKTIQARLMLLIDLVYRLVLFGSVPAAVDRNGALTSPASSSNGGGGDGGGDGDGRDSSKGPTSRSAARDEPARDAATSLRETVRDATSLLGDFPSSRASRRLKSRELYEMLSRTERAAERGVEGGSGAGASGGSASAAALLERTAGETSRTSALRQSLRSSLGAPPLSSGRREKRTRSASGGSSGGGGGGAGAGAGGGGGGGDASPPSAAAAEENRRRKECRKATLERVHRLFWSSGLPAAVCVPLADGDPSHSGDGGAPTPSGQNQYARQTFTPLACLIAAHEILRARPAGTSAMATNAHLRGLEKGISLLGRMVDPGAASAVVVVDPEVPHWSLAAGGLGSGEKSGEEKGEKGKGGGTSSGGSSGSERGGTKVPSSSRKRDRASSQERPGRSGRSSLERLSSARAAIAGGASSGAVVSAPTDSSPAVQSQRAKRARTAGSVSSLLERLTQVDASIGNPPGGAAAAASRSVSESGGSSLFASRYRSAMESMLRGASPGAAAAAASRTDRDGSLSRMAAAASRADRDGSLSRILASHSGSAQRRSDSGALGTLGGARPPRPPTGASAASAASAGTSSPSPASRSLLRARAVAGGEADEWRVLNELPAADVMEVDEDAISLCQEEEAAGDGNEEDGEVEENNDGSDVDDDSEASEIEEVVDATNAGAGDDEDGEDDDDEEDEDENYEDETDDDEAFEDAAGQFDDAVINLDEINVAASPAHRERNPHRHAAPGGRGGRAGGSGGGGGGPSPVELALKKREREQAYLRAAMQVMAAQYPELLSGGHNNRVGCRVGVNRFSIFANPAAVISTPLLNTTSEQSLLKSLCNIVKPPRKPLNLKIFMRRAPTQEEFFRGSLSRNPIGLSSLKASASGGGGDGGDRRSSGGGGADNEPRVSDLRLHIAKDLQMEDSAELLELLVANKIMDMNLKLRVVQQVLWKKYVEENATSASSLVAGAGPSHQMISTGSGLSMIFSSSGMTARRGAGADDNAILASFPPMVVTYRLAGVDGEATEDKVEVEDLEDPEAPVTQADPRAIERRMEKEFGITRMVTKDGGVAVLLASVRGTISELLRRIRRDEVASLARRRRLRGAAGSAVADEDGNITREGFAKAPPCPGLVMLRHCANLADNRKKMLANRAPTLLLRILLDILNAMNRSSGDRTRRKRSSTFDFSGSSHHMDVDAVAGESSAGSSPAPPSSSRNRSSHVEGNPTTEALQEIIEMLASDISAEISDSSAKKLTSRSGSFVNLNQQDDTSEQQGQVEDDDSRTLPLVLKSLHSTELSPPLRKVIAKLLPFLTYGQVSQSRELASYFMKYVDVTSLGGVEVASNEQQQGAGSGGGNDTILMNTFVETAINLPPVSVCDNLRRELIRNGFVDKVRSFLLEGVPAKPPSWSPALYPKKPIASNKRSASGRGKKEEEQNKEEWRAYFDRPGMSQAFRILTGLCSKHAETQLLLSDVAGDGEAQETNQQPVGEELDLLTLCHWMEVTSDNTASDIKNPNGILAETLLDALKEDNDATSAKIKALRGKTRDRKRELAEERRNRALVGMSAFGALAGAAVGTGGTAGTAPARAGEADAAVAADESSESRSLFSSMFSSLLAAPSAASQRQRATRASAAAAAGAKPAWMAEMEAMEEEVGATCAVCQEGRTLQPSELLGLYAYVKKVSIPSSQGGGKGDIDGAVLLLSLPTSFPSSLMSADDAEALFEKARSTANALEGSSHALSAMTSAASSITGGAGGGRSNHYITTVSAGNAIHCSCHKKAKAADRNHPKAPKSEWEGASLRNSRVTCNVIMPLVSSKTSKVPLVAVETALADYSTIITNTLGARPKSILWNCLHDIRFLLLRMAHGEALGADCGGGSSSSNFLLALYQLYSADMFALNSEHDESVEVSRHARGLSAGFLVGVDIVDGPEFSRHEGRSKRLERGVADAAPMAALCSILFYNADSEPSGNTKKTHDLSGSQHQERKAPPPTRQWELYKSKFLLGLVRCAGRRHSLGLTDSGCVTSRGISTGRKNVEKARSFADWSGGSGSEDSAPNSSGVLSSLTASAWTKSSSSSLRRTTMIEEYSRALRPMLTLYAVFDQLSKEFVLGDDEGAEESSERLAAKLESCYKAEDINDLLRIAEINDVGNDLICKYFEKGATS